MSTINDTDQFIVQRGTDTHKQSAVDLMSTIQDTDLMVIQRGTDSYKVTCKDVKEQLGGGGLKPPSVDGAVLTKSGSGTGFSGNTFTTSLTNYDPGFPAATQTMKARVVGSLQVVGETSAITNVGNAYILADPAATTSNGLGNILPGIVNASPTGQFAFNGVAAGAIFSGNLNDYLRFVNTSTGAHSFEIVLSVIGANAGDQLGIYSASAGDLPNYANWSIWFVKENGDYVGSYVDLNQSTAAGWDDITVPAEAARVRFYSRVKTTDYGQMYLYGFRINQGPVLDNGGDKKLLTLTDRKDLDNGLFVAGDTVISSNPPVFTTPAFIDDSLSSTPTVAEYVAAHNANVNSTAPVFIGAELTDDFITISVPSSGTLKLGGGRTSSIDAEFACTGTFTSGPSSLTFTSTTISGEWVFDQPGTITLTSTNDHNGIYFVPADCQWNLTTFQYGFVEPATVVSINQTSPEMTVSGGTWNVGETVKNTVARAPVITPTTDEIVGLVSETSSADWYATANKSSADAVNNGWDRVFNGTQSSLSDGVYGGGLFSPTEVFVFNPPLPAATYVFAVYFGAGDIAGGSYYLYINGEDKLITDPNWSGNSPSSYQTYTYTGPLDSISLGAGSMYLNRVSVNGTWMVQGNDLGLSSTTLTLASDKDFDLFTAGDDVEQDSGYTPQTSAITNVDVTPEITLGTISLTGTPNDSKPVFTNPDSQNYCFANNNNDLTFAGTPIPVKAGQVVTIVGGNETGRTVKLVINTDAGSYDTASIELPTVGKWNEISSSNTTDFDITADGTLGQIITTSFVGSSTGNGGIMKILIDGEKILSNTTAQEGFTTLTLTDDTDLANFRVGDRVEQSGGTPLTDLTYSIGMGSFGVAGVSDRKAKFESTKTTIPLATGTFTANTIDGAILLDIGSTQSTLDWTFTGGSSIEGEWFASNDLVNWVDSGIDAGDGLKRELKGFRYWHYELNTNGSVNTFAGTLVNISSADVVGIGPGNTLTVYAGTWSNGDTVTGPTTTPATGTVASTDTAANTMTLSVSDETYPKRWIVNAGKTVLGPTIQVPSNLKLYSSDFLSDPEGTLAHTQSDWQITLKTDTTYSSPVSQSLNDSDDLTVWEPSNLEEGTAYRCRVRHKSNNVVSEWSDDSTFKTAETVDNGEGEIVAAPGYLHRYVPQNLPVKFNSTEKFVNYTCGAKFLGVGESGNLYIGPEYNEGSGSFTLSNTLTDFVVAKGEKAIDVYTSYAIDPENPGSTLILCESGNAYFNNSVNPIATNVKRIIKLGGVSRVCILETNDGTYIGANTHSVPYYIGSEQVPANTIITVSLGLPPTDNEIASVTGLYGSYDAQSLLILSSQGNLYLSSLDGTNMSNLGLQSKVIPNNAAEYIQESGWLDLQGKVTAIGCFSDGYSTSAAAWIRTDSREIHISSLGSTACWSGGPTTTGPVKVMDNALTGAMSSYNSLDWYVIDTQGYAWDASTSRVLTKNTTAGAIFGPQGSGHASYNYSVAHTFVIADI